MKQRVTLIAITYLALAAFGLTMLFPFLWMLSSSLKREEDVQKTELQFIPRTTRHFLQMNGQEHEVRIVAQKTRVRFLESPPPNYQAVDVVDTHHVRTTAGRLVVRQRAVDYPIEVLEQWAVVRMVETGELLDSISPDRIRRDSVIDPQWGNYSEAWHVFDDLVQARLIEHFTGIRPPFDVTISTGFVMFYINSIIVVVAVTVGQLVTCSMAAFAFSRLRFPGRDVLFFGYLATMMIPAAVTLVPVFMLMTALRWTDTYKALILPGVFSAYGTFLLRQFFMTLPRELEEAAKIDGAGLFRIYLTIALPLSKPALATLATFTFMGNWQSFLWPLLMLSDPNKFTLPLGLQQFQTLYTTRWHLMMAASMIALIPVIILFIFNQRYFVEGVKLSGIKG